MANKTNHVIIAGVPRSGSTSLYTYLAQHPDICGSDVKETQHFLPSVDGVSVPHPQQYMDHFKQYRNEKYLLEASPSYFFGGQQTAKVVFDYLGTSHIVILLRDPINRLHSCFNVYKMVGMLPQETPFEAFIHSSDKRIERGIPIETGFYIDYLACWHAYFQDSLQILYFDDLNEAPLLLMRNLCQWLGIDDTFYKNYVFTKENRRMSYKNKQFHMMARYIHTKFEPFFRRNLQLKQAVRKIYFKVNESSADLSSIQPETYKMLQAIYEPYNRKLAKFLLENQYPVAGWLKNDSPSYQEVGHSKTVKVAQL